MKKYTIEIVAIILAIAIGAYFWIEENNKPEPEVQPTNSQVIVD